MGVCCPLVGVCCPLVGVCCPLVGVCCPLMGVCCLLVGVCCPLMGVCCPLVGVCCPLVGVCCPLVGVCCLLPFILIHSFIHLLPLIRGLVAGAEVSAEMPRLPSPQTLPPPLPGGHRGVPRPAGRHSPSSVS
uniref:Uncharacterized protein n=1 Tax=Esox lucius TaxID=8010 RepID=A0AAY5KQJ1_ESOLU